MSKSVNNPTSFDSNSIPSNVEYPVNHIVIESAINPVVITQPVAITTTTGITDATNTVGPICQIYDPIDVSPWPTIIISVLGAIVIIYTAVAPNVDENRRIFGVVFILLWTLIWAILLWVLWREYHRSASWWLLLVPVIAMALFFVLIIVMNVGSSI